MNKQEALHKLGIHTLYDFQNASLSILMHDKDLLVFMPTSAGKSLIFTLFSLLTDQLVIVLEPHLALELDQVHQLTQKGIAAACLNSLQSLAEWKQIIKQLASGTLRLLYITPEMLQNKKVQAALCKTAIAGVMVDEAHCVCKQGPGFRDDYLRIRDFICKLPTRPTVGAFTATATCSTEAYIIHSLGMDNPHIIRGKVVRDNIQLQTIEIGKGLGGLKDKDLIELRKREIICKRLKKLKKGRVIIYSNTIKRVNSLSRYLREKGFAVGCYHGKCDQKADRLKAFIEGETRIMVATNSFGLGINVPDIRLVIHHAPLIGLDDYTQEAGRAGRDGKKAKALLLWHEYDFLINRRLIAENQSKLTGTEMKERLAALEALQKYAQNTHTCRWELISNFFGQSNKCGKPCDNCKRQHR